MEKAASESRQVASGIALITRVLGWFFLFGFIMSAVQLIVHGLGPLLRPEDVAFRPEFLMLSGAGAGINLMLAVGLLRISRGMKR